MRKFIGHTPAHPCYPQSSWIPQEDTVTFSFYSLKLTILHMKLTIFSVARVKFQSRNFKHFLSIAGTKVVFSSIARTKLKLNRIFKNSSKRILNGSICQTHAFLISICILIISYYFLALTFRPSLQSLVWYLKKRCMSMFT